MISQWLKDLQNKTNGILAQKEAVTLEKINVFKVSIVSNYSLDL